MNSNIYHLKNSETREVSTVILPNCLCVGDHRKIPSKQIIKPRELTVPPNEEGKTLIKVLRKLGELTVTIDGMEVTAICFEYEVLTTSDL